MPKNKPTIGQEKVAGANKHKPCIKSIKPPYIMSLSVHSRPKKRRRRGLAYTSEKSTFFAPSSAAWASLTGFGTARLRLSGAEKT